jgi:flavin reductase (DIM6/NTAB) family NADH-FMN oxidoreductase RutF
MDTKAMFKFSYGLFVLTAKENGFDNGCIINTAIQVTSSPNRISIAVNKANKTHDMIHAAGEFNVCMLAENAPFSVFQNFGFQSGRDADKFASFAQKKRSANGIYYITDVANAYVSAKVVQEIDLGTHTMFIADVTDAEVLSDVPSVTYNYYQANIKPKPQVTPAQAGKTKWVCKICGYVYEGEELPADFICPICKHGAQDFEKVTG